MDHWPGADLSIEGVYVDGRSIQAFLIDHHVLAQNQGSLIDHYVLGAESRVAVYLPFLYVAVYISVLLNC